MLALGPRAVECGAGGEGWGGAWQPVQPPPCRMRGRRLEPSNFTVFISILSQPCIQADTRGDSFTSAPEAATARREQQRATALAPSALQLPTHPRCRHTGAPITRYAVAAAAVTKPAAEKAGRTPGAAVSVVDSVKTKPNISPMQRGKMHMILGKQSPLLQRMSSRSLATVPSGAGAAWRLLGIFSLLHWAAGERQERRSKAVRQRGRAASAAWRGAAHEARGAAAQR